MLRSAPAPTPAAAKTPTPAKAPAVAAAPPSQAPSTTVAHQVASGAYTVLAALTSDTVGSTVGWFPVPALSTAFGVLRVIRTIVDAIDAAEEGKGACGRFLIRAAFYFSVLDDKDKAQSKASDAKTGAAMLAKIREKEKEFTALLVDAKNDLQSFKDWPFWKRLLKGGETFSKINTYNKRLQDLCQDLNFVQNEVLVEWAREDKEDKARWDQRLAQIQKQTAENTRIQHEGLQKLKEQQDQANAKLSLAINALSSALKNPANDKVPGVLDADSGHAGVSEYFTVRYKDVKILGRVERDGFWEGMRAVWQEIDVMAKMMRTLDGDEEQAIKQLNILDEVAIWARLHHRNILPFYGVVLDAPIPFTLSPYIVDGSVDDTLLEKNLTSQQRAQLIFDVALGMRYMHRRGYVHTNLGATHVLLDEAGRALVCDFSLALTKLTAATTFNHPTTTPRHMPPERMLSGVVSQAGDVYAFALLCYQIWTGLEPYSGISDEDFTTKVHVEGLRPDAIKPMVGIPDNLKALIHKCWDANPTKRPTFEEIVPQLRTFNGTALSSESREMEVPGSD